jgi:hypothetical protein
VIILFNLPLFQAHTSEVSMDEVSVMMANNEVQGVEIVGGRGDMSI